MGYYTSYCLGVTNETNNTFPDNFVQELEKLRVFEEIDIIGTTCYCYCSEAKWYDWEQDMCLISKKFPEYLFDLEGDGEESDDFWKAYFKNGMVQHCPGRIEYEPFNPDGFVQSRDVKDWDAKYSYEE